MSFDGQREFLAAFGWNLFFEQQIDEREQLVPARVIGEERGSYRVQWNINETAIAVLSGKVRHGATGNEDLPAVGDWVLCKPVSGQWPIEELLARQSLLSRRAPGGGNQLIAANVDQVFVATALNQDFNLNRIERYLIQIKDSGARPVILLTKSDLHEDPHQAEAQTRQRFPRTEVLVTSLHNKTGMQDLVNLVSQGSTSVLVGSSGVGKSSLLNFLLGDKVLATQDVRDGDGKGRHTTTARYLFATVHGGLVIDTPGMREFGLNVTDLEGHGEGSLIDELVVKCKFTDCSHGGEPGCAIQAALQSGELARDQWENHLKMQKEIQFHARKHDKALQSAQKDKWKKIHMAVRQKMKMGIK